MANEHVNSEVSWIFVSSRELAKRKINDVVFTISFAFTVIEILQTAAYYTGGFSLRNTKTWHYTKHYVGLVIKITSVTGL